MEKNTHLKNAIQQGLDSGIAVNFDPKKHLKSLKKAFKSKSNSIFNAR